MFVYLCLRALYYFSFAHLSLSQAVTRVVSPGDGDLGSGLLMHGEVCWSAPTQTDSIKRQSHEASRNPPPPPPCCSETPPWVRQSLQALAHHGCLVAVMGSSIDGCYMTSCYDSTELTYAPGGGGGASAASSAVTWFPLADRCDCGDVSARRSHSGDSGTKSLHKAARGFIQLSPNLSEDGRRFFIISPLR